MGCLGLVGGLAVGSTCHCYKELAQRFPPDCGTLDLCMVHADLAAVLGYVAANEPHKLADYLLGLIERLRGAGATLIAIPAVTPHCCIAKLKELSPLPIVNLLDVIVLEVQARPLKKVAIFGTKYVMKSKLFGVLDKVVEVAMPSTEVLDRIHELYLRLARQGFGEVTDISELNALAQTVSAQEHVDAVILAGTDFSVIPAELLGFSHVDCTDAHLRAILEELCGQC